jgi:PleD family two-component response regulator
MMTSQIRTARAFATTRVPRQVVVVSRNPGQCVPGSVMDAEDYDVVVLESPARAYSQIKRVKPNLVIMCFSFDDLECFQVLSMLKVDVETARIPVRMYAPSHSDGFIEDRQCLRSTYIH